MRLAKLVMGAAMVLVLRPAYPAAAHQPPSKPEQSPGKQQQPAASKVDAPREPGYLGLAGDDRGEQGRGVRVLSIRAKGPAQKAGILPGDLVLHINGQAITSLKDMATALGKLASGDKAELEVDRRGQRQKVVVILSTRPRDARKPPEATLPSPLPLPLPLPGKSLPPRPVLGIRVSGVTEQTRRQFGLVVRRGALIQSIRPGSPADQQGLPLGGAIVAVDGRRIDSPDDLLAVMDQAKPGQELELTYYQRDKLFRKKVRLGPTLQQAKPKILIPPGDDPPLLLRPDADDRAAQSRPGLKAVERVLDAVRKTGKSIRGEDSAETTHFAVLRTRLEVLQKQVDELQKRIAKLEHRLKHLTADKKQNK